MMNYSGDDDVALEQARYDIFRNLLPVIVCMIMFGVAGVIGNVLTIIFYAFKTKRATTVILIACLAVADLTVCVLFIPNIVEMWANVEYNVSFMCKLAHFIGLWAVAASGLILWSVAIDRHRKICFPFGRQMTLTTAKYVVIGIVVFGFLLSVRNFANFDTVEVDVTVDGVIETVNGRYCTTRDDSSYIASVTVFTAIDFLLMLMVWFTLVIAYSHIIYTLFKLKKTRKRIQNKKRVTGIKMNNLSYEADVSETHSDTHEAHYSEHEDHDTDGFEESEPAEEHIETNERLDKISIVEKKINMESSLNTRRSLNDKQRLEMNASSVVQSQEGVERTGKGKQNSEYLESITEISSGIRETQTSADYSGEYSTSHLPDGGTLSSDSKLQSHLQKRKFRRKKHRRYNSAKSARERNLTFKMLTVSLLFIICFTPYFIVKIWMREVLKSGEEYELSLWSQIFLRLPYMNSVFNPVVYCVFNLQFRLYIKSVFTNCFSKCFNKAKYLIK